MLPVSRNTSNILIIFGALLLLTGAYWHYGSIDAVTTITIMLCALVFMLMALFTKTWYFFLALIALLPLSVDVEFGGSRITAPSEAMLLMLIPVLFLFHGHFRASFRKALTHPITIILIIDILIQLITTLTSSHIDVSLKRLVIRVVFLLGFYFTVLSLDQTKRFVHIWLAYAIGLIPVMYSTLRNHSHHDFDPRVVFSICEPFYNDHTVYGACLAFIIPILFVFIFYRKKLNWNTWIFAGFIALLSLILISIGLALSRAALLSVIVAAVFALMLRFRVRLYMILAGLLILSTAIFMMRGPIFEYLETNEAVSNDGKISNHLTSVTNIETDASNMERVNRWICAMRMFEERPLLGFGPGTYQFEYNQFQTMEHKTYISTNVGDKGNAHSEYLTYLSENGIFGLVIFLITVFGAVYFGMQNHYHLKDELLRIINLGVLLGLVTYFFHGLFNAFMDQSKMGFLYFAALGTIVWINMKLKEQSNDLA